MHPVLHREVSSTGERASYGRSVFVRQIEIDASNETNNNLYMILATPGREREVHSLLWSRPMWLIERYRDHQHIHSSTIVELEQLHSINSIARRKLVQPCTTSLEQTSTHTMRGESYAQHTHSKQAGLVEAVTTELERFHGAKRLYSERFDPDTYRHSATPSA